MSPTLPPWLSEWATRLHERVRRGRLPHALLFCGPRGCGKRLLADWLVALVLCVSPAADGSACGRCRECVLRRAGTHPDVWRSEPTDRPDGRRRHEILIEQVRELIAHLAVAGQRSGTSIAVIDPADRLNAAAANAFLKTLEEPAPGRLLILIADEPARVRATIRSRCTRIEVRMPPAEVSLPWLLAQGLRREMAEEALRLAEGQPLRALAMAEDGSVALARTIAGELDDLAAGRTSAAALARVWAGDRPELRLKLAQRYVLSVRDRLALTDNALFSKLDGWLGEAARVERELSSPLKGEFLIAALLARWSLAVRS